MRVAGILFLLAAAAALIGDWRLSSLSGEAFRLHPLGEVWFRIDRDSYVLLQPAVERHVHPDLWFALIEPLTLTSGALLFGAIGGGLLGLWALARRLRGPGAAA